MACFATAAKKNILLFAMLYILAFPRGPILPGHRTYRVLVVFRCPETKKRCFYLGKNRGRVIRAQPPPGGSMALR